MQQRLAIERKAAGPIGHQAFALRAANQLAKIRLARQTELALAAFRRVERNDMVVLAQRRHTGANVDNDAGTFVAEDRREQSFGIGPRQRVVVRVTNAGRLDLNQHLAGTRSVEIDVFDRQWLSSRPGHGRARLHRSLNVFRVMPVGSSLLCASCYRTSFAKRSRSARSPAAENATTRESFARRAQPSARQRSRTAAPTAPAR